MTSSKKGHWVIIFRQDSSTTPWLISSSSSNPGEFFVDASEFFCQSRWIFCQPGRISNNSPTQNQSSSSDLSCTTVTQCCISVAPECPSTVYLTLVRAMRNLMAFVILGVFQMAIFSQNISVLGVPYTNKPVLLFLKGIVWTTLSSAEIDPGD